MHVACWVFEQPEPLKNQTEKTKLKQDEMNRNEMGFSHMAECCFKQFQIAVHSKLSAVIFFKCWPSHLQDVYFII
jgi:hypothetical protein